jgi:hypothetical protein
MQRRSLLGGLAGCLAAGFAPAAIGSGILMPVRKIQSLSHWPDGRYITYGGIDTRYLIISDEKGNILFSSEYEYTGSTSFSQEANRGIKSLSLDPPSFQAIHISEHRA